MFGSRNAFLTAAQAVIDPFWKFVSMLLPGTGTNGAQNNTFLDSSTNNFTITRNGNTTQGTFTPYGSNWSNYFDGSGDYLSVPSSSALSWGTGDYTVECWLYLAAATSRIMVVTGLGNFVIFTNGSNQIVVGRVGTDELISTNTITLNTWNHIAVTRASNTTRIFINGVSAVTPASITTNYGQNPVFIGSDGSVHTNGYISNFRAIKGTAIYTSDFTPPIAPLTAISGTSLLTCQSNRIIDNSSNNFTVTRNGDVSVQRFSPFNPPAPYSTGAIGGSGYFDGNGDYLSVPDNASWVLGNNFTIECWVYFTSTSGIQQFINQRASSANAWQFLYNFPNSGDLTFKFEDGNVAINRSWSPIPRQWYHIAVTRSGNTWYLFSNGVQLGATATNSTTFPDIAATIWVGTLQNPTGESFVGYMSNLRVTKSAVYTANFTVPTSPVTAIANTQLLLNFTNGGVIDNAMMNDLETVGNAQISTAQSKFGFGSIFFDGNGDNLFAISNPNLDCAAGNWTIECWVYISSRTNFYPFIVSNNRGSWTTDAVVLQISNATNASYNDKFVFAWNNGGFSSPSAGTSQFLVSNVTNATATWYHFAVVRNGTSVKMYRNGTEIASATVSAAATFNWGFNGCLLGGGNWDGTQGNFNGYINDFRFTKGYARYTANFTPPTKPFPLQ